MCQDASEVSTSEVRAELKLFGGLVAVGDGARPGEFDNRCTGNTGRDPRWAARFSNGSKSIVSVVTAIPIYASDSGSTCSPGLSQTAASKKPFGCCSELLFESKLGDCDWELPLCPRSQNSSKSPPLLPVHALTARILSSSSTRTSSDICSSVMAIANVYRLDGLLEASRRIRWGRGMGEEGPAWAEAREEEEVTGVIAVDVGAERVEEDMGRVSGWWGRSMSEGDSRVNFGFLFPCGWSDLIRTSSLPTSRSLLPGKIARISLHDVLLLCLCRPTG